jgi:DNA polymerase-3 subunit delta'
VSSASIQPAVPEGLLAGVEHHPHARAILVPALAPAGAPSHAYLFHGPAGTGKRTVARAFAAALLAEGAQQPDTVMARVARTAHPDLTWVTPSGASEVLVSDIDEPVVAAAAHTPFESKRRVFVIESAGTMNDQAANRLLKTLEEPPSFAHLILLAEHREDVLPTIASRCQQVRFDPLPNELVEQRLSGLEGNAIEPERAGACARLAAGDGHLAELLASERGVALRECAEQFVRSALDGRVAERRWMGLLEAAKGAGAVAGAAVTERLHEQAELLPSKERRRYEREGIDVVRRSERRARTATLELGLRLAELWLRDLWCLAVGAPELVFACDRSSQLAEDVAGRDADSLRRGIELVCDMRLRLALNVSEELALEALSYRLASLLSAPIGPRRGSRP